MEMGSKDYTPDGGCSYREMSYADNSIRKLYRHEFKLWLPDENILFARREKTVTQCERYFANLMRCYYVGERASFLQEIDLRLMSEAL